MQLLDISKESDYSQLRCHEYLLQKDLILNMSDQKLLVEVFCKTNLASIGDTVVVRIINLTVNEVTHFFSTIIGFSGGKILY